MPRHIPQAISEEAPPTHALPSPIAPKEGMGLLERMNLIEWAVQSAIIGDNGPLTSSPNQRRNMALVMADVAGQLTALAQRIDPLAEPIAPGKVTDFTYDSSKPYKCSECQFSGDSVESVLIHKSRKHPAKS